METVQELWARFTGGEEWAEDYEEMAMELALGGVDTSYTESTEPAWLQLLRKEVSGLFIVRAWAMTLGMFPVPFNGTLSIREPVDDERIRLAHRRAIACLERAAKPDNERMVYGLARYIMLSNPLQVYEGNTDIANWTVANMDTSKRTRASATAALLLIFDKDLQLELGLTEDWNRILGPDGLLAMSYLKNPKSI